MAFGGGIRVLWTLFLVLFPDESLSIIYQWIFTKLDMCIDIVYIWFGIANGQISSIFDRVICLPQSIFLFLDDNFQEEISMDFHQTCIAKGQFLSVFGRVICPPLDIGRV